jgi:tRNA (guanine37-N1)-methyltransferase
MSNSSTTPWHVDVLTLFPEYFDWMQQSRPIRNAIDEGQLAFAARDMRPFSPSKHHQVDDTPYGGGAGMVLRVDVVVAALAGIYETYLDTVREQRRIVLLSPAGRQFDDAVAREWAADRTPTTILCGRYEGFDHRIHEHVATEEISIGPYVLSGGEIPAMAMVDAVARKLPGALGNEESLVDESFSEGLDGALEYPHYTRPAEFRGWTVPDVLLSGHHGKVDEWRRAQSLRRSADGYNDGP